MSDWTKKFLDLAVETTSHFDLGAVTDVTQETFAKSLAALSPSDRTAVRAWAESARDIRAHAEWSNREKEERIQTLDNNATVLKLIRALFDVVADKAPAGQRQMLKMGLTAAAVATAGLNFEITGLALIALRAALPAFLLSEPGDRFCAAVLEHTTSPDPLKLS